MERLDERPFPPGEYDVVLVGSGPGGLQTAYSLARTGIPRCAVISRDPAPGGMFRRYAIVGVQVLNWRKRGSDCLRYASNGVTALKKTLGKWRGLWSGSVDPPCSLRIPHDLLRCRR